MPEQDNLVRCFSPSLGLLHGLLCILPIDMPAAVCFERVSEISMPRLLAVQFRSAQTLLLKVSWTADNFKELERHKFLVFKRFKIHGVLAIIKVPRTIPGSLVSLAVLFF